MIAEESKAAYGNTKQALLDKWRKGGFRETVIPKRARQSNAALSFGQQRLWFLDQLGEHKNSSYHMVSAVRLTGALDADLLRCGLAASMARHESLRTTFAMVDGEPRQVVSSQPPLPWRFVDLAAETAAEIAETAADTASATNTTEPAAARESHLSQLLSDEARQPFDLERGPVFRACLVRLEAEVHVLMLTMHHIVSDGWSIGVLVREVGQWYASRRQGAQPSLPPLSIQYGDFAEWQRGWLQGETLERQLQYWTQQLGANPPLLALPTDRARPPAQSYRGARHSLQLGGELSAALRQFSQREGATLFMTLLSAFYILLGRYSGQQDLVVGTPVANRNRAQLEPLIGFFANMLVLRGDLSGQPSFRELLRRTRQMSLDAFAHQDLPFERLVEHLQPERTLEYNPLFQVVFALQMPPLRVELPGLQLEMVDQDEGTTRFDLEFHCWDYPEGIRARLVYSTDLFDQATIKRLGSHFQTLLQAILKDPDKTIANLDILSENEKNLLITDWNQTSAHYPDTVPVNKLVEAQATKTPEAIAVHAGDLSLTYAELDRRANTVAGQLRLAGVGSGDLVALFFERSVELVIGMLGALKAGAAYLPIDTSYPSARVGFILEDANVRAVLTHGKELALLPERAIPTFTIDASRPEEAFSPLAPESGEADGLAYVIYTSGSTGQPKGVEISHSSLLNLVHWHQRAYSVCPSDRATMLAGVAFDASVWEVWPYLCAGASLHIPGDETRMDSFQLRDWLIEESITLSFMPTQMAEEILRLRWPESTPLRALLTGGDQLRTYPGADLPFQVVNHYGPTECTVVATAGVVVPDADPHGLPGIGCPISNIQAYLLDQECEPVPVGVPGELYLAGASLARGYRNRPALTSERFTLKSILGRPAVRLYRTGDLMRYCPDGSLQFIGRADEQVKIRGYRIELNEIRSLISQHPAIQESIVVAREDRPGEKYLAAYFVPAGDKAEEVLAIGEQEKYISNWQKLYDETYSESLPELESAFNIVGWRSSYTGEPIPSEEMREQVEGAVARILALKPSRVLEIGCGTGLLLFRIAPHCELYLAKDFSATALRSLEPQIARQNLRQVELRQSLADDFSDIESGSFDTVVINSTVQYFPGKAYLERVLSQAIKSLAPGGSLFVGDIRNFDLHAGYCASVQLYKAPSGVTVADLKRRIAQQVEREEELLIAPAYFRAFQQLHPRVTGITVQLRRGSTSNELTRFRYDVVFRLDGQSTPPVPEKLDWNSSGLSLHSLRARLQGELPQRIRITNIPNARLASETRLLALLASDQSPDSIDELRRQLEEPVADAVDPEDLWSLGDSLGYRTAISWTANGGRDGQMEAFLERGETDPFTPIEVEPAGSKHTPVFMNNPLKGRLGGVIAQRLRSDLAKHLPEYMIPAAFVLLDAMPLTANGKIDHRALPAVAEVRREELAAIVLPRNPLEEQIAAIWRDVLNLPACGVFDNFFELGGHSLLATQLLFRMHEELQVTLPLRSLFATPTIASMAAIVASLQLGVTGHDTEAIDLRAEAMLDPSISPRGAKPLELAQVTNPRAVLLTGATGFLGAFLLQELLRSTAARVYCLVRAKDNRGAMERIVQALGKLGIPYDSGSGRVVALAGDLGSPLLGLSAGDFSRLAGEIDSIYHNGALINFTYPYSQIKAPNVSGAEEVLRLACMDRLKPVYYVSTSATLFNHNNPQSVLHETDQIAPEDVFKEPYVSSKWVAEELVRAGQSRGIPAVIFRPLRIVGASDSGACQESDLFWMGMRSAIEIGALPDQIPIPVAAELIPVDYAAQAIVHISRQESSLGRAFHITHPNPPTFSDLFSWIRAFGYPLAKVSVDDWKQLLLEAARQEIYSRSPRNSSVARIATLLTLIPIEEHVDFRLPVFDSRQTRNALKGSPVKCPPLDLKLMHHYLRYFVDSGHLPVPSEETRASVPLGERIQNSVASKLYTLLKSTRSL